MRVLITGGFGYLGGCLSQHLENQTSHEIFLGTRNKVSPPAWAPHAQVVQTVWDSPDEIKSACLGVDVIVHMAGMNAHDCTNDPVAAFLVNTVGTVKLLQGAIRQGVKRFIYLSTAHVYGNPLTGVITEEIFPTNLHSYASSHRAGEDAVLLAHQKGEIEGIVVRLSNAFGAPMHKEVNCWMLLVNNICRQVVSSRQMVLQSGGLQTRNFVTMSDVCGAITHLILLHVDMIKDGLFNLGGQMMRVVDMAEMVQERSQKILNLSPNIIRTKSNSFNINSDLDFRFGKLLSTGFALKGDSTTEIDDTLLMCNAVWGEDK